MSLLDFLPEDEQAGQIGAFATALAPAEAALTAVADLELQLDPRTAGWGLPFWEAAYGTSGAGTLEERRAAVIAAISAGGTATVAAVRALAEGFSGGEVEVRVTEVADEHRIELFFVDFFGEPSYLEALSRSLRAMLPAHIAFSYEITYRKWGEVADRTWGDLGAVSWDDVKGGDIGTPGVG